MNTALLVIDVQESFRHHPCFDALALPAYMAEQNVLIEGCAAQGVPVVRILHSQGPETLGNPFSHASGHVRPLAELSVFDPAASFVKHRHSALVGTGLDVWLIENGIRRLIVSGIRTEQCCETTTRHASDLGWEVDFVTDATLTFDMTQPNGLPLSSAEIKVRTATVLQGRFCTLTSVGEALARAGATT